MAYQILETAQTNKMDEVLNKANSDQNGSQQGQNFCLDDKDVQKKKNQKNKAKANRSPYSCTKMKAKNFLSNISYRRISDKDFQNVNFVIDMLSYILLYIKPFFLTATYSDREQQDMVTMLWEKCLPIRFYEHIKLPENFEILNSGKLNFNQAKQIVLSYVQQPDIWQELIKTVIKNQVIYQYIYSMLFPLNYLQTNKYGIKIRNGFSLCYSEWLNDKFKKEHEQRHLAKNPFNFAVDDNIKRHPVEQKPITTVVDSSNKENIPPTPLNSPSTSYKYSPAMANLKRDFDKKYSLPTVRRQKLTSKQKTDQRNKKKEELSIKLAEVEEKMKLIKAK